MNNLIYYIFAACSLLLLSNELTAQEPITFERYYSDSGAVEGKSIQQTFDGGYIVAGRRNGAGMFSNDAILMKTDSLGDVEWLKVYATNLSDDEFYDVKQTNDSGYIACGYYPQLGMGDNLYIVKTDINGDTLWTRVFGSNLYDIARSVAQTYDGGFVLAGQMDSTGIVVRLDAQGDTIWTKRLYDVGYVSLYSVAETVDSGFVTTGVINTFSGNQVYIACIDKNGILLWEKNYGYGGADYGYTINVQNDSIFFVGGYSWQFASHYDSYILKMNLLGDTLWTKLYSLPTENGIVSFSFLLSGNLVLGEQVFTSNKGYQAAIVFLDSLGTFLGRQEYGEVGSEFVYNITTCNDGGFAITGLSDSYNGISRLFIYKTDEFGIVSSIENSPSIIVPDIKVWPNPFHETLNLDLTSLLSKNYHIRLYNTTGQKIWHGTVIGGTIESIRIDVPIIDATYFLQVSDDKNLHYIITLVHN